MGLAALVAGVLLLIARLVRLGFLANFLSRMVLIGFLSGVGISVTIGQLPQMLGVTVSAQQALPKLIATVRKLPHTSVTTLAAATAVIAVVLILRLLDHRLPGALIVVVAAIAAIAAVAVSTGLHLQRHGIRVIGPYQVGCHR